MQLKLVCSGLVALVRWRPTAFLEITPSCVREYPLRVVSPRWGRSESGRSAPADLIVLKLTFRRSAMGHF
jgi:hypothetical protein